MTPVPGITNVLQKHYKIIKEKKMKKQLIALLLGLIMTVSSALAMTYDEAINQNKPIVIMFHMHGCSACQQFSPIFDKFASQFSNKFNFVKEDVNSSQIATTLKMDSVPAIFIIHPKTHKSTRVSDKCAWDSGCFTKTLQNY